MRRRTGRTPLPPGFAAVWVTVAINMVGFGIVIPILPLYAKRFHATSVEATLLIAVYSAAALVMAPVWGRVSDRIGRRPVLLVSLVGTAAGSLLTGLAGGLALLFVGRVVDGVSGSTVPVAQATVGDLATPDERAHLFGLLGAAFGLGFVAGPAIGALAAVVGPRVPFYVAAAIAGGNALVALRRLPETRHAEARAADDLAVDGLDPDALHPDALHPDDVQAETLAPTGPALDAPAAGGADAGSPPPGTQAPGVGGPRRPGLPVGLAPLLLVSFCALTAFSAFEATLAIFGHRHLGLSIGSSAAAFALVGVALAIVQGGLVRPLVGRLGEERTLQAGLAADVTGLLLLAFARNWVLAVPALAALTVGQALVQTTMASTLSGRVGAGQRGRVLGLQQAAGGLGRIVGPALGGVLLGSQASGGPFLLGAALCAVALVALQRAKPASVRSREPMLP